MSQAPPQQSPAGQNKIESIRLSYVSWKDYTRFLRLFAERPKYRLTYDRGELEIMSPLFLHDNDAEFLGVFVGYLVRELRLPIRRGGSTTLRRRKWRRGLEPDKCYWIANAHHLVGHRTIDLRVDPAPDLAIEIDLTSSSLDRRSIYATLGVPELWHLDGDVLTFYRLQPSGYMPITNSLSFPILTPGDLIPFLQQMRQATDETVVEDAFLAWLRQRLASQTP